MVWGGGAVVVARVLGLVLGAWMFQAAALVVDRAASIVDAVATMIVVGTSVVVAGTTMIVVGLLVVIASPISRDPRTRAQVTRWKVDDAFTR